MNSEFRQATIEELPAIWEILKSAIERRKIDGSNQWQDGYPNPDVVRKDIDKGSGFVLTEDNEIVGYCSVLIDDEPAYADIQGNWLTDGSFVVYHRVAIADRHLRKGYARKLLQQIEVYAQEREILSIRADTNFDNHGMLGLFEQLGYVYCGEVFFRGSARKAYEKVLKK